MLDEFIDREHILISYSGITGIVDDGLEEPGLTRKVKVASTHFSALPFLLVGSEAIATIPDFASLEIARDSRFAVSPCPISLPKFAVDIGWHYEATVRDLASSLITKKLAG